MECIFEITSVPIIISIVYGAVMIYKQLVGSNEKWIRLIPIISAVLGAALGAVLFYTMPETIAANNILAAILIGGASGLAATGTNQIFKQMTKNTDSNNDVSKEVNKNDLDNDISKKTNDKIDKKSETFDDKIDNKFEMGDDKIDKKSEIGADKDIKNFDNNDNIKKQ